MGYRKQKLFTLDLREFGYQGLPLIEIEAEDWAEMEEKVLSAVEEVEDEERPLSPEEIRDAKGEDAFSMMRDGAA